MPFWMLVYKYFNYFIVRGLAGHHAISIKVLPSLIGCWHHGLMDRQKRFCVCVCVCVCVCARVCVLASEGICMCVLLLNNNQNLMLKHKYNFRKDSNY